MSIILNPVTGAALSVLFILYTIYRKWTRISLRDIPGPKNPSFFVGRWTYIDEVDGSAFDVLFC